VWESCNLPYKINSGFHVPEIKRVRKIQGKILSDKITNHKIRINLSLLIPYEQNYIQTLYLDGKHIPEQSPGEMDPLFQTVINPESGIPHEQASCASACNTDATPTQTHRKTNTYRSKVCAISNAP